MSIRWLLAFCLDASKLEQRTPSSALFSVILPGQVLAISKIRSTLESLEASEIKSAAPPPATALWDGRSLRPFPTLRSRVFGALTKPRSYRLIHLGTESWECLRRLASKDLFFSFTDWTVCQPLQPSSLLPPIPDACSPFISSHCVGIL